MTGVLRFEIVLDRGVCITSECEFVGLILNLTCS